ncbi:MAG: IS110 family transposase [Ketobacter sp.]|nr:IS110 family transposase [Ketobacter sp.]
MTVKIVYVGIDVDDKAYHGSSYDAVSGDFRSFKCKPTAGSLLKKLSHYEKDYDIIRLCYEASYIGCGLCRILRNHGIECDIIAPSSIPTQRGGRVKTDRLDSLKLAQYFATGLLTSIEIPTEEDERVRSLIRTRQFQVVMRKKTKLHIQSHCRYMGLDYKAEAGGNVNYWTVKHLYWLQKKMQELEPLDRISLEQALFMLRCYDDTIGRLEAEIEQQSQTERFKDRCELLCAFKGIQLLTAMTLLTELGDIRRFAHPKQLTSYCGLDISEYSSGGKEKKYGITKMGNRRVRTTLIESCQTISRGNYVGKELIKRREKVPQEYRVIAEKCQFRLSAKRRSMEQKSKHPNKIKAACAREMLGFIWEALTKIAA